MTIIKSKYYRQSFKSFATDQEDYLKWKIRYFFDNNRFDNFGFLIQCLFDNPVRIEMGRLWKREEELEILVE